MAKTGTDEEKHAGNVFFDYLIDMTNKMKKLVTSEGILVSSGVNYGGNINKRNCAMSAVAEALGMPHIIAKSVPMTVKVGENEYKTGTFMQLAKGSDPDEKYITSDDPILTLSPESTQSKNCFQAVKDAADLQVLDFICGNVDRHTNNMFYQVENGKIIGIQGIDNDSAFGVIDKDVLLGNRSHLQFVGISNMKIMDVKTAKRVLDMTPEYLRKTISGFGLRPYEIDAACERLKLLQNSLDNSYLKHPDQIPTRFGNKKIYVLNDNQMKQINLSREIGVTIEEEGIRRPGNAFSQIRGIISRIIKMKNKERETRKRIAGEEKEFKQVTVGQRNQGPDFAKYGRALDKHISAMENVNHGMFFASPEFKNVLAYAKYMKREMEAMSQEGINEQNVSKAYNMFENLVTFNSLYLNHKNTDGSLNSKERARNRALAVNALQDMASNYVTRFGLNEREQYRHLCQRMRISSAQRKRDNRTIADAIQRLTAQGAAGGEEEPRFVQVIDGIRARRAEAVQAQAGLNR